MKNKSEGKPIPLGGNREHKSTVVRVGVFVGLAASLGMNFFQSADISDLEEHIKHFKIPEPIMQQLEDNCPVKASMRSGNELIVELNNRDKVTLTQDYATNVYEFTDAKRTFVFSAETSTFVDKSTYTFTSNETTYNLARRPEAFFEQQTNNAYKTISHNFLRIIQNRNSAECSRYVVLGRDITETVLQ